MRVTGLRILSHLLSTPSEPPSLGWRALQARDRNNRKQHRDYDQDLYKLRHLVENAFLHLKQWRGVATRYAKNSPSYLAACQIRAMFLWSRLF